jgi:hypothetical protein
MAQITHRHTFGWGTDSGAARSLSTSKDITDTSEANAGPVAVNTGVTDQAIAISFAFANVASVFIKATADMTLETNSGSSPADTHTLKANVPLIWFPGFRGANPFTVNVTGFFLTNTSGQQGTFEARVLYH